MASSRVLVLSTSLNPASKSRKLARLAFDYLGESGVEAEWIDLRDLDLPICDGDEAFKHPDSKKLRHAVAEAKGILLGTPIYNYAVTAAAKNAVELGGRAFTGKVVGFICAAGGRHSYMSVMNIANSLMLDFRSVIVPRFVYAPRGSLEQDGKWNPEVVERTHGCADELVRMASLLVTE
jgi:FMN reductase